MSRSDRAKRAPPRPHPSRSKSTTVCVETKRGLGAGKEAYSLYADAPRRRHRAGIGAKRRVFGSAWGAVCERSPGEQPGQIRRFAPSRNTVRIANPAGCAGRCGTDSRIRSVPGRARAAIVACPVRVQLRLEPRERRAKGSHGRPRWRVRRRARRPGAGHRLGPLRARSGRPLSPAGSRPLLHDKDLGPRFDLELASLLLPHPVEDPKHLTFDVLREEFRDGRIVDDGDLGAGP